MPALDIYKNRVGGILCWLVRHRREEGRLCSAAQRHKEDPLSAFPERAGGGGGALQVLLRTGSNDMLQNFGMDI